MMQGTGAVVGTIVLLNVAAAAAVAALALAAPMAAGLGALAWLLGARHAFDADHIVAIDNVARHLVQRGQPSVAVGLWFSLGHSTVVAVLLLALWLGLARGPVLPGGPADGGVPLSLAASAAFLTAAGAWNIARARHASAAPLVGSSRAMYPVGLLFGLNLDTASQVVLLAITIGAADAPAAAVPALALLFTAGMVCGDALGGLAMTRLYGWSGAAGAGTFVRRIALATGACALGIAFLQWFALFDGDAASRDGLAATYGSASVGAVVTMLFLVAWFLARTRQRRAVAGMAG